MFVCHVLCMLNSQWTSGCVRVKSDSRKAACGGITYSSRISVTTAARSHLFSVTRENKSTCDVQPSSATSDCERSSCSSSSTRGSSLAISQRAARLHSWRGRGSVTVSDALLRCPRSWAESTKDLVPSRMADLICTRDTEIIVTEQCGGKQIGYLLKFCIFEVMLHLNSSTLIFFYFVCCAFHSHLSI